MSSVEFVHRVKWLLGAVPIALLSTLAVAQDEAKPKAEGPKRPAIYDPKADARAQVATATARARRDNSRVLLMFGYNGCGWCHKLHELFGKNAEIAKLIRDEYVFVMVDIESPHADELLLEGKQALANDELQKGVGFPFLEVLDGAGKVVTAQRTDPLEEGDHHDPNRVKEFLARWVSEPRDAQEVLGGSLARATSDDKRLLLHFGAPWCGWCHRLDDFLSLEEIASILTRDYLDVKIDVDRMKNGKEVLAKYRSEHSAGIPWCAILDAGGKVLATSDGPKGNIGYPAQPEEIEHFLAMLEKTRRRIEPEQLDRIKVLLQEAAVRIKEGLRPVQP